MSDRKRENWQRILRHELKRNKKRSNNQLRRDIMILFGYKWKNKEFKVTENGKKKLKKNFD
jgi:hypothetical protein